LSSEIPYFSPCLAKPFHYLYGIPRNGWTCRETAYNCPLHVKSVISVKTVTVTVFTEITSYWKHFFFTGVFSHHGKSLEQGFSTPRISLSSLRRLRSGSGSRCY